jgi:HEAT repeat protein
MDPTSWDLWWKHNRDGYLALRDSLDRIHPRSGPELGGNPLDGRRSGLSEKLVWGEVVPVLQHELASNKDERVVTKTLLALARIGEAPSEPLPGEARQPLATLRAHLTADGTPVAETAVIALGVLGTREAVLDLVDIARDTRRGRKLVDERRVPLRSRALAAYGIAIAASYMEHSEVAQFAAWHLVELLESDGRHHPDLQAACVIGMGIVPLDVALASSAQARGTPSGSRASAAEWLLENFLDKRAPNMLRAHAPVALSRLVQGVEGSLRARVVAALVSTFESRSGASSEIRAGCIMALGALVDSDEDPLAALARRRLLEAADGSNAMERNFALLALAEIGSRPGTGAGNPVAGVEQVRKHLLSEVKDGRSRLRPWAGLALGLMGHGLRSHELDLPAGAAEALAERLHSTRSPEDAAAYAVGAGLLGDVAARAAIEEGLLRYRDEHWRASMAVALGLLGDPASLPALRRVMQEGRWRPELVEQAAIARALLGDRELVDELMARLADSPSGTDALGVTRALAWTGDGRALPALLGYMAATERVDAERALAIEALGWIADKERVIWDARISAGLNYVAAPQTLTDPWGLGILDTLCEVVNGSVRCQASFLPVHAARRRRAA